MIGPSALPSLLPVKLVGHCCSPLLLLPPCKCARKDMFLSQEAALQTGGQAHSSEHRQNHLASRQGNHTRLSTSASSCSPAAASRQMGARPPSRAQGVARHADCPDLLAAEAGLAMQTAPFYGRQSYAEPMCTGVGAPCLLPDLPVTVGACGAALLTSRVFILSCIKSKTSAQMIHKVIALNADHACTGICMPWPTAAAPVCTHAYPFLRNQTGSRHQAAVLTCSCSPSSGTDTRSLPPLRSRLSRRSCAEAKVPPLLLSALQRRRLLLRTSWAAAAPVSSCCDGRKMEHQCPCLRRTIMLRCTCCSQGSVADCTYQAKQQMLGGALLLHAVTILTSRRLQLARDIMMTGKRSCPCRQKKI